MTTYNKDAKNAQCPSALGLLTIAEQHKVATAAINELLIKSYGLQCSTKLSKPREFMLSQKDPKPLFDAAITEAEKRYGASYSNEKTKSLVAKQALYLLCGRDKSNKVKDDCQEWRNSLIEKALTVSKAKDSKAPRKPRGKKQAAEQAAA